MSIPAAQALLFGLAAYLGAGLLFALPFALRGVDRVDPAAQGAPLGFRLLILPGCAVFWPLLLRRWLAAGGRR